MVAEATNCGYLGDMHSSVPEMNPAQGRAWLALMAASELLPARLDAQLTAQAGLIHFEYAILAIMQAAQTPTLRMGQLAAALACPAPKLSKAVTRLEKGGLLERVPCAEDRRAINVQLTPAGRELWLAATPSHLALARDTVLAGLDEEQLDTLAELLEAICDRLDPDQAICNADQSADGA